jgi:hypothetical protein
MAMINLRKAISLAEEARYKMGVSDFVLATIDHWAHAQTGMHPPKTSIPAELVSASMELTNCLAGLMREHPGDDVLGAFFSECNFHLRGTNFFPTPPEISALMAALIGEPEAKDSNDAKLKYYEPCCGTGSIALKWLNNLAQSSGLDAVAKAQLVLEDIDEVMVKACMIQMLFFIEHLGVEPQILSVVTIDVLSRQKRGVAYYATSQAYEAQVISQSAIASQAA